MGNVRSSASKADRLGALVRTRREDHWDMAALPCPGPQCGRTRLQDRLGGYGRCAERSDERWRGLQCLWTRGGATPAACGCSSIYSAVSNLQTQHPGACQPHLLETLTTPHLARHCQLCSMLSPSLHGENIKEFRRVQREKLKAGEGFSYFLFYFVLFFFGIRWITRAHTLRVECSSTIAWREKISPGEKHNRMAGWY